VLAAAAAAAAAAAGGCRAAAAARGPRAPPQHHLAHLARRECAVRECGVADTAVQLHSTCLRQALSCVARTSSLGAAGSPARARPVEVRAAPPHTTGGVAHRARGVRAVCVAQVWMHAIGVEGCSGGAVGPDGDGVAGGAMQRVSTCSEV
jgi:hypothetical protein